MKANLIWINFLLILSVHAQPRPWMPPAGLVLTAHGTGKTTGHIANISVTNKNDFSVSVMDQVFYIPSDGNYQSYVGRIPGGIIIPPGAMVNVPVNGVCTDVTRPPVPSGSPMPPIDKWVPVGDPSAPPGSTPGSIPGDPPGGSTSPDGNPVRIVWNNPVPRFDPGDIPKITGTPVFTPGKDPGGDIIVTWPGTDIPVGGTLDPREDPESFAPIVVEAWERIEEAADVIQASDEFSTPFSNNPPRERESIIQQTVWWYTAAITDNKYEQDDFAEKVYDQYENATGRTVSTLATEQKEELDTGIADFWNVFMAVGVEAKVISHPERETVPSQEDIPPPEKDIPPPEKTKGGCSLSEQIIDTGPKLDYAIADTGTKGKNEKVKEAFRKAIEEVAGIISNAEGSDTIDVGFSGPEMPASAWSLYFPHVVAGQANASAFVVDMKNPLESAWTTQPLQTKADGQRTVILTHHIDGSCKSTLVGINYAKVRAASGLKASLGSIDALKVVNFVGEIAIDIVLKKGKGTYKKLSKYLKEKTKDMAKDKAKEFIEEQLGKLRGELEGKTDEEAEQTMDELLKEIKEGKEEEEDTGDFLDEWLAEQLIEGDDFNPLEKIEGDILDKIDSPIDWSPIKTNTYTIAEGSLEVWVEGDRGLAKAASGVRYKREELESKEEAEKGGGVFCDEGMASETTSGKITLKTIGNTSSYAGATGEGIISTGHGIAIASLESFNGQYVIAICECPEGTFYDTYISITAYTADEMMTSIWSKVFENLMEDVVDDLDDTIAQASGRRLSKDQVGKVQKDLESAAARAGLSILPCKE